MNIGQLLLSRGEITRQDYLAAVQRQKVAGGLLSENLLHMGSIKIQQLRVLAEEPPPVPITIEETGLGTQFLLDFMLKTMFTSALQTVADLSKEVKLSQRVVETVLDDLRERGMVEIVGAKESQFILRYVPTGAGRARAIEALNHSRYIGPAPVPLESYQTQVEKQSIINERIEPGRLGQSLSHLVLPDGLLRKLGPAVNSSKATLLYGASGNGKSSIAESLANVFRQLIYVPYAIKVDEQIIKVFDAAVHREAEVDQQEAEDEEHSVIGISSPHDQRWAACHRPLVISGGELTLGMLDLDFDPISKHYEAPLQVKAMGGVFVIDDFGRQLVRPEDLLNRWIVPLERKVDYLTLHTGKKFMIPFDEIVVFSTNLSPAELMDAAFLRRVKYKIRIDPPTHEEYRWIFSRMCDFYNLPYPDELVTYVLEDFYGRKEVPISSVHPKMIVEHVIAASKFQGKKPELNMEMIRDALENLVVSEF